MQKEGVTTGLWVQEEGPSKNRVARVEKNVDNTWSNQEEAEG